MRKVLTAAACLAFGTAFRAWAVDDDLVDNYTFSNTVMIAFAGTSATVSSAVAGVTYTQDGANLVFTSAVDGVEYVLSGTASGGCVRILGSLVSKVTLNDVNLTCTNGPAVAVLSTNRCFVVLAANTANTLTDGATYTLTGEGTLYGAGPLIVSGTGRVTVSGKKKNGIYSASYIRMRGGDVTVSDAVKDGLHVIKYFRMDQGTLAVLSGSDASTPMSATSKSTAATSPSTARTRTSKASSATAYLRSTAARSTSRSRAPNPRRSRVPAR